MSSWKASMLGMRCMYHNNQSCLAEQLRNIASEYCDIITIWLRLEYRNIIAIWCGKIDICTTNISAIMPYMLSIKDDAFEKFTLLHYKFYNTFVFNLDHFAFSHNDSNRGSKIFSQTFICFSNKFQINMLR